MKKYNIIISLVLAVMLSALYLYLDKKLFYYGKSDFTYHNLLPMDIQPRFRYDFEGGFALEEKDGFGLIFQGESQYIGSDRKLDIVDILKYGFNNDSLVALVEDQSDKKYYISCTPNKLQDVKREMNVHIINEDSFTADDNLVWVNLHENVDDIEILRNLIPIPIVLLLLIVIMRFVMKKKLSNYFANPSTRQ